jgi:two-component system, LuxR family, sensor kinase FixL
MIPSPKPWGDNAQFLASVLDSVPGFVTVLDRRGRFRFVNRLLKKLRSSDVIGKPVYRFIAPESRPEARAAIAACFARGKSTTIRVRGMTEKGVSWYESTYAPLRKGGKVEAVVSVATDITERVLLEQTENDLKRLRERFENVFNHSSEGMTVVDMTGRYLNVNPAYCRITGYSRGELCGGRRFADITAPESRAGDRRRMREMMRSPRPQVYEKTFIRKDRSRVDVGMTVFPLMDAAGRLAGFGAIVRDLAEKRRFEEQIYKAGEREQRRLGRDLHDGIGQYLTGIALMARSCQTNLSARLPDEARAAGRIAAAANAAIAQTRALAQGLIPTELNGGLKGALSALAENARALFNVPVGVTCPDRLPIKDPKIAVNLYRIAQEAVHNACRHGKAGRVTVAVTSGAKGSLTLRVADDGVGLPSRLRPGLGLRTMTYRAQLLGGTLDITGRPKRGVVVVCRCAARG